LTINCVNSDKKKNILSNYALYESAEFLQGFDASFYDNLSAILVAFFYMNSVLSTPKALLFGIEHVGVGYGWRAAICPRCMDANDNRAK
jgi:hypothetical protein